MFSFTEPWGFVKNSRDERGMLASWRQGLDYFGFAGRFVFFRDHIMTIPILNPWLLPRTSNESGMGYLMSEADKHVSQREEDLKNEIYVDRPDFLQHCLDARIDGHPLTPWQKRSHVTLLIQAGADTTGTGLGSTLRFLVTQSDKLQRAESEIRKCDQQGLLSTPIKYEETRKYLPYFVACIKESLRLNPPVTNLFPRVIGKGGKSILGHYIPEGTEVTSYAHVVQRDPDLYAPDPNNYRPERWLESQTKALEMDAANFSFGLGPRVCLGKDIAIMELYKLLPEIVRRFEIELVNAGKHVVAGGVAYNDDFVVKLKPRI